jgi:cation diffusion facilitator CzcD-associated flavoprotein CzcO
VLSSFDCSTHIYLKQECIKAEWRDEEFLWQVTFTDGESEERYIKYSRYLITAVGFCDVPKDASEINGVKMFQGRVFHSANWDHTFDFRDKDVVVVGNGCSANQFIPELVNKGRIRSLVQIVRSAHWIAPKKNSIVPDWQKWYVANSCLD